MSRENPHHRSIATTRSCRHASSLSACRCKQTLKYYFIYIFRNQKKLYILLYAWIMCSNVRWFFGLVKKLRRMFATAAFFYRMAAIVRGENSSDWHKKSNQWVSIKKIIIFFAKGVSTSLMLLHLMLNKYLILIREWMQITKFKRHSGRKIIENRFVGFSVAAQCAANRKAE